MNLIARPLALAIALIFAGAVAPLAGEPHPSYVGSPACAECHQGISAAWSGSDHALAWMLPGEATVLGDFDDATFEHAGVTTRFTHQGGDYFIETQGPDGVQRSYRVVGTAGIRPLQQYLVEIEPGRVQVLDIAWDIPGKRWYHLYPDADQRPGTGFHWGGPYKSWNARCAECHATAFEKDYDLATRHYDSRQAEIGVGCEACHGPGEAHVQWARDAGAYRSAGWSGLGQSGFAADLSSSDAEVEIQQCAGCHALREPYGEGNPLPGTPFHDAYRLTLLRAGAYHADGSILDEVYVYGSFLQSKMYAQGVRCTDCHDPHAARLRHEVNAVCTQCHSPAGNSRFPTLRKADYDNAAHHFHPQGTAGAECRNCHMIERTYMGVDGRRDHSFRVPRPDLSVNIGTPNACTDCHQDRTADWAAAEIAQRYPDSAHQPHPFAETFSRARTDPKAVSGEIMAIAETTDAPGIVRASALDLLRQVSDEEIARRAANLLTDADPLVRMVAIQVQRGASAMDRVQRLVPMLSDPSRSVRIAAARELLDAPFLRLPDNVSVALRRAMGEWQASLVAKADFPEAHMAMGGAALVMRNFRAAEAAFREVVRLDPQIAEAWVMIVRMRALSGDEEGARAALAKGLAANPTNPALIALRDDASAPEKP